jgi:TolB-like protein
MKRCPQCNRIETDESLGFCRSDGTALVNDSGVVRESSGTLKLSASQNAEADKTRLLSPDNEAVLETSTTEESLRRPTAPTSVLVAPVATGKTRALNEPKFRKAPVAAVATVITVALIAGAYLYWSRGKSAAAPIESIAVMPFINASGNADVEYLSDGMTETLINSLSQLPKLAVKARSSVFRYKGKEVDPQVVGNELSVQAIVNGRVVQRGDDLTLYLSLVDTRTGNQIWGEQYNRKQVDLISLQSEIGRDVSSKLRTKLSGADEQKLGKSYTANPEAYQLYLQGRFFWNKRTPQTIQKSIEYFQQAIEKDPNYALGYAGLADGYSLLAYYGGAPANEVMPKAKVAALRALSLDSNLAEAHASLGFVFATYDADFAGAEREYKRAIELNPNYTMAHQFYGVMLTRLGRQGESVAELRRALEIEPLSMIVNRNYGESFTFSRRYDESVAQLKKTLELDPTFPTTYLSLSIVYQLMGKYAESIESFAKCQELLGHTQTAALARESFARGGWKGYLRAMTGTRRPGELTSSYTVATFHVQLGQNDKAFAELDKALENREYLIGFTKVDPRLDPLRDDPRFEELLRRIGFPQ